MNFIQLQGLVDGTVSGRNNGLLRCYGEFQYVERTNVKRTIIQELERAAQDTSKKMTEATKKVKVQLANEKGKLEAKIEGLRRMNEEKQSKWIKQQDLVVFHKIKKVSKEVPLLFCDLDINS